MSSPAPNDLSALVAGRLALVAAVLLWTSSLRAELKLVEVRPTYGKLGSTRQSTKVLPGDDLHVEFVVSGVAKGPDGRADISLSAELLDSDGEAVARVPAASAKNFLALGGNTFTSHMHFSLPLKFPEGKYKVKGVLTDVLGGGEIVAEQEFEVLPMDFGVVRLRLASDAKGTSSLGGNLTVNQDVYVVARGVGFERKGKRIHVVGNMIVKDSAGKPTTPAPISVGIDQEVDEDLEQLDFNWSMVVNRPGKFTVQIEMRDEISGKKSIHELPLVVSQPPTIEPTRRTAGEK